MLAQLQKRVRKGYFKKGERLSWAPFPSFSLLSEGEEVAADLAEIMVRICRYFGGETVALAQAREEGLFLDEKQTSSQILFERLGYYYGPITLDDPWLPVLAEKGRLVLMLPEASSSELLNFGSEHLAHENVFVMSESALRRFPYRIISDLLFFVTNHEAPVIVEDLMASFFPQDKPNAPVSTLECQGEITRSHFNEAVTQGEVLGQDYKFYRTN